MKRVFAVLAGLVAWTILWISANQGLLAALPEHVQVGEPIRHVGVLLFLIVYSAILSVLAGWITARVGERAMEPVWALALVLLAFGIFFQATSWSLFPLWYHLIFLGLVVPMTVVGGRKAGAV